VGPESWPNNNSVIEVMWARIRAEQGAEEGWVGACASLKNSQQKCVSSLVLVVKS
jgi:hypothetical protein